MDNEAVSLALGLFTLDDPTGQTTPHEAAASALRKPDKTVLLTKPLSVFTDKISASMVDIRKVLSEPLNSINPFPDTHYSTKRGAFSFAQASSVFVSRGADGWNEALGHKAGGEHHRIDIQVFDPCAA